MAKSNRKARRRKARLAKRAENLASQGKGAMVARPRNQIVLDMLLNCKGGSHGDAKKNQSKTACRTKVKDND